LGQIKINVGDKMSNQHNEKEFEKIMQEVELLDQQGKLEAEVHTVSETYGLHEDDDRDDILFFIAENLYEHGVVE
tara:strand:+ start:162 stop:386 length:225 start_codon:yes stop_codon:yes gene_type:complete